MPPLLLDLLLLADELGLAVVDEDLGAEGPGVVVAAHGESVGSRVVDDHDVALVGLGEHPVVTEVVAGLADGSRDVELGGAGLAELASVLDVVEGVVHGGPDEGVESGVHSDVLLGAGVLHVGAPGEQDGGVADEVPSGLQDDLPDVGVLLEHVGDLGGHLAQVHLVLVGLVGDPDSSSDVHELEVDAGLADLVDEFGEHFRLLDEGLDALSAGADVGVDSDGVESQVLCPEVGLDDLVLGDAELGTLVPGDDLGAVSGADAGGDPEGYGSSRLYLCQTLHFGDGVEVDHDPRLSHLLEFLGAHEDTGVHDLVRAEAGLETGLDLADGDGVDARSLLLEDPEDGQVGVGLAGVVDLGLHVPGEGLVDVAVVLPEPLLVGDVAGGAEPVGQFDDVHAGEDHAAVLAVEIPHGHQDSPSTNLLWRILMTGRASPLETTKLMATLEAPSEIMLMLAPAALTAPKMSPLAPVSLMSSSPTQQISATSEVTSIFSTSSLSSSLSLMRVFFTSLLWMRNATVESEVEIE